MKNWKNRVYDNLKKIIDDDEIDYRLTNEYELVADKTVYLQMLSNEEIESDLENTEENAQTLLYQIETYTKSLADGYELFDTIVSAMKQMHFTKSYGIELFTNTTTDYKRLVARFSRVIGSGEEIIKV